MTIMKWAYRELPVAVFIFFLAMLAFADTDKGSNANLAQQANNPIANMISVPFQLNANYGVGPGIQAPTARNALLAMVQRKNG